MSEKGVGDYLNLKSWREKTYKKAFGKHDITLELGLLKRRSARPLQKAFLKHFRPVTEAPKDMPDEERGKLVLAAMEAMTEELGEERLRQYFHEHVRHIRGLTVDGQPLASGEEFFDIADDTLIYSILMDLNNTGGLTEEEGKTSASRSTSPSEETESGPSPAPSTEREAGPTPSTATPIPTETRSSSEPEPVQMESTA
jgi:hypothetical protein